MKTNKLLEKLVRLQKGFTDGWEIVNISIVIDIAIIQRQDTLTKAYDTSIYKYDDIIKDWFLQ